ncbi:DUF1851 domain-containing protein [Duganella sp. HH105]|uniref:DUF1851 domain-containing protein n=1 Tax=Duganella sp. HH105 TaxID=1781067 RepID=UPI0009FBC007|nr:DUF1851 domain-containing protein [Duganella sp. HH105]
MIFFDHFRMTCSSPGETCDMLAGVGLRHGVYNEGLLLIPDSLTSKQILAGWQPLLGDATVLAATAFGDIFFWSPQFEAVFFLEIQRGQSTFVARSLDFLFNDFLVKPEIREDVLKESTAERLIIKLGRLGANESFIAEPWLRRGGNGSIDSYTRGSLIVYSNLVATEVINSMKHT